MISDEDMYLLAEALARWADRDIAAGLVSKRPTVPPLAQREDDQQREHAANHKGNGRGAQRKISTRSQSG
jgi:hypothetical protein